MLGAKRGSRSASLLIKKGEDRKTRQGSESDQRGGELYGFYFCACLFKVGERGKNRRRGGEERRNLTGLIPNSAVANLSDSN